MRVMLEYGEEKLAVDVPDGTTVVGPRKLVPPFAESPDAEATIRDALEHPLGSGRIRELVTRESKVLIAFPDKVKGGQYHRRLSIPIILKELKLAGVSQDNVTLLCTNGLHRMNTRDEIIDYLGNDTVSSFWPNRLICHDAEDEERMVHVGASALGDRVDTERLILESDLVVLLGHALPNHYGGFSGGYKGLVTGTGSWRSIAAHHSPTTIMNPDLLPVSPLSTMRKQFNAQGQLIEKSAKGRIFCLDAALNINGEIVGEFAGDIESVQKASWPLAKKIHSLPLSFKFDIVIVGLPVAFHYGPGMGTNPILMLNALGGLTARLYPCIKETTVLIAASVCDGWINDEYFPSYREVYERYRKCSKPSELVEYETEIASNPEYVSKYRFQNAYHPFHAFSMMYYGEIALRHTSRIFVVGAKEPAFAKAMGFTAVKDFPTALHEAKEIVGADPNILALPSYFLQIPPLFEFKG